MCGICGIVMRDGAAADPSALDRMVVSLDHRGPDGRGTFVDGGTALGHTRLSIVDLSPALLGRYRRTLPYHAKMTSLPSIKWVEARR